VIYGIVGQKCAIWLGKFANIIYEKSGKKSTLFYFQKNIKKMQNNCKKPLTMVLLCGKISANQG
jgi:hypothetical protein